MSTPAARPRILFLCQSNPWRLNNGGIIRNYWLVQSLADRFDVDLVTADEANDPIPATFASRCAEIRRFPRPVGNRARVARLLGSLRPGSSYFTSGSVTAAMKSSVARMAETRDYVAAITELGLADALPRNSRVPVVYSSHNCEAALLRRRAELESPLMRAAVLLDARRVQSAEARLIDRSVFAIPCSPNDVSDIAAFAPAIVQKSVVVPNGVDCASYAHIRNEVGAPGCIVVTGSFDWVPNRRGLLWFLKDVLPILEELANGEEFRVRVAGRMTADFAKKLDEIPHVTAVPNPQRMDIELRAARVVAVPVIASSGTRLRILESWAAGRAIVTTSHGAFGLRYADGGDLLIGTSPREFADAVSLLLRDEDVNSRLRVNGIERAATYDWSVVGKMLVSSFEQFGIIGTAAKDHSKNPRVTAPR